MLWRRLVRSPPGKAPGASRRSITSELSSSLDDLLLRARRGELIGPPIRVPRETRKTVLLLHPPGACSAFTRSGSKYPPLGLTQLKAVIGDENRVDVLEADGQDLTIAQTLDQLRTDAPRAVGMTITCVGSDACS